MEQPASISGLVVTARPGRLGEARRAVESLPGLEVHGEDAVSGKLVVVQELPSLDDHIDGLRRIQGLPDVMSAELVCHVDETAAADVAPGGTPKRGEM